MVDFAYDGDGLGKSGSGGLSVDDKRVAEGRIEKTVPNKYSLDEALSIG